MAAKTEEKPKTKWEAVLEAHGGDEKAAHKVMYDEGMGRFLTEHARMKARERALVKWRSARLKSGAQLDDTHDQSFHDVWELKHPREAHHDEDFWNNHEPVEETCHKRTE